MIVWVLRKGFKSVTKVLIVTTIRTSVYLHIRGGGGHCGSPHESPLNNVVQQPQKVHPVLLFTCFHNFLSVLTLLDFRQLGL